MFSFFKRKKKEKIKIAFFVPDAAIWSTDELFNLFVEDVNFDPYIVIFPYEHAHKEFGNGKYIECLDFFKKKGFKYITLESDDMLSPKIIKQKSNADMVFLGFTTSLIRIKNIMKAFRDKTKFYIPYGTFLTNFQEAQFNHRTLRENKYYLFWESILSLEMSKKYASNKGKNSYYLGYPKLDILLDKNYTPKNVWKLQNKNKKKIIWAPHHSIGLNDKNSGYSCFLDLSDFMLDIADKYKDIIQIAFKPHPLLKDNLYVHEDWGIEKTTNYYQRWNKLTNGQFEPLEYFDLFLTSDAMILDSISFMCEYSAILKPALFTVKNENIKYQFNEYGERVFNEILYKAQNLEKDIVGFIDNVVVSGEDSLFDVRKSFVEKYMYPPNNMTASKNIYDFVLEIAKRR